MPKSNSQSNYSRGTVLLSAAPSTFRSSALVEMSSGPVPENASGNFQASSSQTRRLRRSKTNRTRAKAVDKEAVLYH